MIKNIIDRRFEKTKYITLVDAVIESSFHDNIIPNVITTTHNIEKSVYDDLSFVRIDYLLDYVISKYKFNNVSIYLYNPGCNGSMLNCSSKSELVLCDYVATIKDDYYKYVDFIALADRIIKTGKPLELRELQKILKLTD